MGTRDGAYIVGVLELRLLVAYIIGDLVVLVVRVNEVKVKVLRVKVLGVGRASLFFPLSQFSF